MADAFSWTCPYCNHTATITSLNKSDLQHSFNLSNKHDGVLALTTVAIVCPNPRCREYQLSASLSRTQNRGNGFYAPVDPPLLTWTLKPKSAARQFPGYIPKPILADYEEACLIAEDSPKASATLSRRCLQGMIRNFWGISQATLFQEINELNGKIDATTWYAIDAVRKIGNIGAHMEKDINLIVDVEPREARLLIGLIEFLLADWYVGRHEREEHMKKVIALGTAKDAAKQPVTTGSNP
jgi:Domain of unknown function (DUF4145)